MADYSSALQPRQIPVLARKRALEYCYRRRRRPVFPLLRRILVGFLLVAFANQWVLWSLLSPPTHHGQPLFQNTRNILKSPSRSSSSQSYIRHSCGEIFGAYQIIRNGTTSCLEHKLLQWVSCQIAGGGSIQIDTSRILGSFGGEPVQEVLNRSEQAEKLNFTKGSLIVQQPAAVPFPVPVSMKNSADGVMRSFLNSVIVLTSPTTTVPVTTVKATNKDPSSITPATLLVRRGNYANPCMALLTMYNVYIVLEFFSNTTMITSNNKIIWLDGHARGDLDPVWERLFQTKPIPIKQLQQEVVEPLYQHQQHQHKRVILDNVIVVNTMSAIGDEGYGIYAWKDDPRGTKNISSTITADTSSSSDCVNKKNSTLVAFRNFVLQRYGIERKKQSTVLNDKLLLTFLIRKDYVAHPRSNGRTDRTLVNVEQDVLFLQSQYPTHEVQTISFEGLPFEEQLAQIAHSDILVAVHGAGNIHILFLPDRATFIEYFPKGYDRRWRFRYLAECLNITYQAEKAWIEKRFPDKKVAVRLRPITKNEKGS